MSNSSPIAKKLINNYVKQYKFEENCDKDDKKFISHAMNEKLYDDLRKEIYSIEKDRIKKELQEENERDEQLKNIRRIKILLFESLILGFFVGLLVNQATDVISFLKGSDAINNTHTLLWVGIILICLFLFMFVVYINKIEEFFTKKE